MRSLASTFSKYIKTMAQGGMKIQDSSMNIYKWKERDYFEGSLSSDGSRLPAQSKKKGLKLSSFSSVHLLLLISGFKSCKAKRMEARVTYSKHRTFFHLEGLPSQKKPLFVGKLRSAGRKMTRLVYPH